ncbi:hypothetical protein TorRG33x02_049080, partial [Trema orientale]
IPFPPAPPNMSELKRLFCFSLLVLLILLSQSLPSSAHQGVLYPNLHHHDQTPISPKSKDVLASLMESQKLQIYVRKRSGGGGGGLATRGRSRTSSAIGKRPPFLHVFLCLSLFLGVIILL